MNKPAQKGISSASADLLVELGCEELPPKSLSLLGQSFFDGFLQQLDKVELGYDLGRSRFFYTPRRLCLLIADLSESQPDQFTERRGPALAAAFDENDQPTPAATGFARSVGKNVEDLDTLETDKGKWLYCKVEKKGEKLEYLLFPMLDKVLAGLPIAKPMRWAANDFSFIRPVHWLLVMHGEKVIPGKLFELESSNLTHGHRIHSPGPHTISSAADYENVLENACVVVDQDKRRTLIEQQVRELGKSCGGEAVVDADLLDEVNCLVEWPRSVRGSFDKEFLEVPAEALIASMQDHQKFFPVVDRKSRALQATFIAVANLESQDLDAVRAGFERVIRPRLADARFFWEQDKKSPLEAWLTQLDRIVFQDKLGTVRDKSRRISSISRHLAKTAKMEEGIAERAALLCKCDLVSQMVGEFPELQGIMGGYYAMQSGEHEDIAQAISEHYRPAYSGDELPSTMAGKIVSMADRVDSLCGIFAAGLKPTGNKDPFALRRAALGLIRILLDGEVDISLDQCLQIATQVLAKQLPVSDEDTAELRRFVLERLKHYLRDQGFDTGMVNATLDAPLTTLPDLLARLEALRGFMQHDEAPVLVAANKRIGNILRKSPPASENTIDADLLIIKEEKHLFDEINDISIELEKHFSRSDYETSLSLLAGLSNTIEAFFDAVMVMDEDDKIRANRLKLLTRLKGLFDRLANFALIG
ncbi:MAG: glycine--tRNA ligase subunit beta [Xanthomonadales bacterium]|nr:glycine--tRNA ligase subunit beta [Xanthomonadales bacterium]